jgi:membrane protein insertase Oxa1/YidC/SpoIIIJ
MLSQNLDLELPHSFFLWSSWIVSFNITTPFMIFLPGINAVCEGPINWSTIPVILFTTTLVKNLKLTFNKQIG